jgi:hypothetical protein
MMIGRAGSRQSPVLRTCLRAAGMEPAISRQSPCFARIFVYSYVEPAIRQNYQKVSFREEFGQGTVRHGIILSFLAEFEVKRRMRSRNEQKMYSV